MSKIKALKKEAQVALPNSGETYIAEDGTVSMVLDDTHDDTYEPSEQEIREYAEWLGMQLPEDQELMWIAREGLRAPLPKEWKPCKTDAGEVYYFNFKTGDSIWDHPMDEHFKSKFKTEKDRLRRAKENGGKADDALSKLPQRNNIIFSQSGVLVHESETSQSSGKQTPKTVSPAAVASPVSAASTSSSFASSKPNVTAKEERAAPIQNKTQKTMPESVVTPTAATALVPENQPKLVSEAEKILQDRIKQECETEHKQLLEKLEREFSDASSSLRASHDQTVSDLRKQLSQAKKSQLTKVENQLQDELEAQQKGVETRTKRDVQRLEEDIERLRDKIRDVQTGALQRMESEAATIENSVRDGVLSKVREIEEEISSIRLRHQKAQQEQIEQEKSRLQIKLGATLENGQQTATNDFNAKSQSLRQQHSTVIQNMRDSNALMMAEEAKNAEAARSGQQESAIRTMRQRQIDECASINARSQQEQARLREEKESKLRSLQEQLSTELALAFRQGSESSSSSAVLAVDASVESQLRQTLEALGADRRRRLDDLAASRARMLAEAAALAPEGKTNFSALEQQLRGERDLLEARLASSYDSLRMSLDAQLRAQQSGTRANSIASAVDRELSIFISKTLEDRRSEERDFERSKGEIEAHNSSVLIADEERRRAVHSVNSAPRETLVNHVPATPSQVEASSRSLVREGLERIRRSFDEELAAALRQQREESASVRSKLTIDLAEELANLEHQERRKIDVELQSEAPTASPSFDVARQQRSIQQQEMTRQALADVEAEYAEKSSLLKRNFQSQMATFTSRTHYDGPVNRNQGASSAPLPKTDALRFLEEQQKDLAQRQQALAHARHEWTDGQKVEQAQEGASLTAIRKYYGNPSRGGGHADPNFHAQEEAPQLVEILSKLSSKLDNLSAKVSALEGPQQHRHSRDENTDGALDSKWSAILQQLSRGNRKSDFTEAVRRYCVGD
jgi:centrosomal protein CEP164